MKPSPGSHYIADLGLMITVGENGAGRLDVKVGTSYGDELESVILAHFLAGVDIESPEYVQGIIDAVDAIDNLSEKTIPGLPHQIRSLLLTSGGESANRQLSTEINDNPDCHELIVRVHEGTVPVADLIIGLDVSGKETRVACTVDRDADGEHPIYIYPERDLSRAIDVSGGND